MENLSDNFYSGTLCCRSRLLPLTVRSHSKTIQPTCSPEELRWLGVRFESKDEVINYLKAHELELMTGSNPHLGEILPDEMTFSFDVEIDWQVLEENVQVEQRLGYSVYPLVFQPAAC